MHAVEALERPLPGDPDGRIRTRSYSRKLDELLDIESPFLRGVTSITAGAWVAYFSL